MKEIVLNFKKKNSSNTDSNTFSKTEEIGIDHHITSIQS